MNDHDDVLNLIQRYADGIASKDEVSRLQADLQDDAAARHLFRAYMELDAALADFGDSATLCESEATCSDDTQTDLTSNRSIAYSKRVLWSSTAIISTVAACLLLAVVGLWSDRENTVTWATVTETGPGVSIVRDGQSRPAQIGDQLQMDEQITVLEGSTAQVTVAGLGVTTLGPEARLRCGTEPRLIELETGFAAIKAKKQIAGQRWRIRTPQVEAAVLGTEFNIASAQGRTALRVSEGLVQLTSLHDGQTEQIRGGNRAFVVSGAAPSISTSRPGSVLLLTSRVPLSTHWDRFNQILIDKLVNDRMWRLGFRVEVRHYEDVQAVDLRNRSLVILSLFDYDVGEPAIERIGLAKAAVPVICLEPAAYPVLGMTVEPEGVGFGFRDGSSLVKFSDSLHPLSGGLVGPQESIIRGIIGWGRPENEAERIAHLPGKPNEAVLFGYDTGRHMTTFAAPARRVGLFLDPTGISEETTAAWTVFEAAVDWCVATGVTL